MMLHGTIGNDNFSVVQHSVAMLENVVIIRNNVAAILQRCVALKIVVANRLV